VTPHFDLVIIGSGAGGGTLAHALAGSGAKILVVERGDFIPQEEENWSPEAVWRDLRYRADEWWVDGATGERFRPYTHYCVGGNTKFWGSVLLRLRPEDFLVLDLDGQILAGEGEFSREGAVHMACYHAFADAGCVFHAHPLNVMPFVSLVSAAKLTV